MSDLFFSSEETNYNFSYLDYINEMSTNVQRNANSKIRDPIFLTMTLRDLELDL